MSGKIYVPWEGVLKGLDNHQEGISISFLLTLKAMAAILSAKSPGDGLRVAFPNIFQKA